MLTLKHLVPYIHIKVPTIYFLVIKEFLVLGSLDTSLALFYFVCNSPFNANLLLGDCYYLLKQRFLKLKLCLKLVRIDCIHIKKKTLEMGTVTFNTDAIKKVIVFP